MGEQMAYYRFSDLASSKTPRERLSNLGVEAISTAELFTILIRSAVEGMNVL
jgi:DNA repair protein RadC